MFHFLQTVEKDVKNVAKNIPKATHKTLNFLGSTAEDVASIPKNIIQHPVQSIKSTATDLAEPFKDVGQNAVRTVSDLGEPASTPQEREALINNRTSASKNPEYQKAIKGLPSHGNSVEGVNAAQELAAKGGNADSIRTLLQKDAQAKSAQDKKALGDTLQIVSTTAGIPELKAAEESEKTTKAVSNLDKLKSAVSTGKELSKEGAINGATNSVGSQLSEGKEISPTDTLKGALVEALLSPVRGATKSLVKNGVASNFSKLPEDATDNIISKDTPIEHPDTTQGFNDARRVASHILTDKQLDDLESKGASTKTVDNFKEALMSPQSNSQNNIEPKSGAQVLNEALPAKARLTPEVTQLLQDTGKAVPKASKTPILEGFRDPQSVASRYFGKEGSDIVYDSSIAAKKRSDIQESANPLITDVENNAKKLSKTTAGQPEVRRRLNQALEDRSNADSYLKTPQEKATYQSLQKAYDFGKELLEQHGIGTLENYSPRIARRDAQDASEGLDYTLNKAFSNKTDSSFTKKRTEDEPTEPLTEDPVAALRGYFSSISKQLAYEPLMKSLPERLQKINPINTINRNDKETGKIFLQKHFKNLLQPDIPTGGLFGEKFQNKLINQTYRSALKFKPSFIITNPTQRLAARSQVSGEAIRLSKDIDPADLKDLQSGLTSGKSTISSDSSSSASSLEGNQTKTDRLHEKLSGEQGNVVRAFNLGASQHIASSPIYKAAIKAGKSAKDAAKEALADPDTKDGAIRDGNVLTNVTQFGANVANKPQVLSEGGTIGVTPLSKKWFQQYKRFQLGTTQLLGNITNPKNARALDIMRRGDPKQTQLVDYLKAAQTLQGAMKEARKTVDAGETNVTKEDLDGAQNLLDKSVKVLNKQIKNASQIRSGKTARNLGLMWAAASTIQFLMQGATNPGKALEYGSPISIPSKSDNPLNPNAPSDPLGRYGLNNKKLLNFIPVVGPVANRASEVEKLIEALTGKGQ